MKTVFDTDEIAHLWMHKTQDEARNKLGNFYFRGNTIYSYGGHFPIAIHVENKKHEAAILFTTRTYSNTTSKHLWNVRNAIPSGVRVFHVSHPAAFDHSQLEDWHKRIKAKFESIVEPRIKQATRTKRWEELQKIVDNANEFAVFFGVKPSFKLPESIESLSAELEVERKRNESKAKRAKARDEKLGRERMARERQDALPKIAAWIAGERFSLPYSIPEAYLRIEDGEVVTSKGASFPIDHAVRAFKFVSAIRAKGEEWHTNGHTFHIGVFKIDAVDTQGNVTAGCHRVHWSEVERFGKLLESLSA